PACVPALRHALHVAALASRGDVTQSERGLWIARGDPTDAALIVAARKAGVEPGALAARYPQVGEVPFSSAYMLTATFHRQPDGRVMAFVKGAPRRVLDRCTSIGGEGDAPILGAVERARARVQRDTGRARSPSHRAGIRTRCRRGHRVLA